MKSETEACEGAMYISLQASRRQTYDLADVSAQEVDSEPAEDLASTPRDLYAARRVSRLSAVPSLPAVPIEQVVHASVDLYLSGEEQLCLLLAKHRSRHCDSGESGCLLSGVATDTRCL